MNIINLINLITRKFGYVLVPQKPSRELLISLAMRSDHSFGMDCISQEEYDLNYKNHPFNSLVWTKEMKENKLRSMAQLHEEVVGTGFYDINGKRNEIYKI